MSGELELPDDTLPACRSLHVLGEEITLHEDCGQHERAQALELACLAIAWCEAIETFRRDPSTRAVLDETEAGYLAVAYPGRVTPRPRLDLLPVLRGLVDAARYYHACVREATHGAAGDDPLVKSAWERLQEAMRLDFEAHRPTA